MKSSDTCFEQIPVETVKKVAQELPDAVEIGDATAETQDQDEVIPQQNRWRELALKVQVENDPQKMTKLVEELIAAFDEEEGRKSSKAFSVGSSKLGPATDSGPHDPSTLGQLGSREAPGLLD
jgi:hypothetical protein